MSEQFDFEVMYQQLKQLYKEKELSLYEANIFEFVSVIKQQPNLLTAEDISSLEDLLKTLPDDVNKISNQITLWYETRQTIEEAIFAFPANSSVKGPRGVKPKITPKVAKELIENVVRQSQPPSQSSTSPSQQ